MNPSPNTPAQLPAHIRRLHELDDIWRAPSAGERLAKVAGAAARFRERFVASGRAACVRTFDLSDLPYPTVFAFGGAAGSPVPFVLMRHRMNLVQFDAEDGQKKTLLFNPTDVARSAETPYFQGIRRRMGAFLAERVMTAFKRPSAVEHLASVGVRPEDVDYVAFDHMHTQDLRGLLGTVPKAKDGERVAAAFPRAKLLAWKPELEIFRSLHPLQRPWYIEEALRGVPDDRMIACEGDLLLGKGVAIVRTPGHTVGNWSLLLNTDNGVWAVSENGVACDNYAPEASRIPGLRRYAKREGAAVVLNSNTLEGRNEQYTSMVLEKALVDRARANPDFYQHQPSSEVLKTPVMLGIKPTLHHGGISSGEPRRAS